jgi:hypothetical protein
MTGKNLIIENCLCEIHGRGILFSIQTGGLFEGWFENNKLLFGRCIRNLTYYTGSFKSIDGICYLDYGVRENGKYLLNSEFILV